MTKRWTLSRAGITNVYQYQDEILHFAGGRLLLRGVNGSGKSTAMNMLLPFLLDADTRRIDAAGEQTGVLRSWMLSGRDDPQPVGYLWIELRRGDEHFVAGCGIRANRSTDRVTTWWFATDRRPGIDFAIVENRVPLSIDALRATLGGQAVFTHDQRGAYRAAVWARLYGGSDIDHHIRLLHVARNPRVGDRIDVDLPRHLEEALPPLTDAAVDDAAQPLEDLEEHRKNVANLRETAVTLEGLASTYRAYARDQLLRRAAAASEMAAAAKRQAKAARRARVRVDETEAALTAADARRADLERETDRLDREIEALQASPAYQEGRQLDDLRRHVDEMAQALTGAEAAAQRAVDRQAQAAAATGAAHRGALDDHRSLTSDLTDLAAIAATVGLRRRPLDTPPVPTESIDGVAVPAADLPLEQVRAALVDVETDGRRRRHDVAAVAAALDAVAAAEQALATAERDRRAGEQDVTDAEGEHHACRQALTAAVDALHEALTTWWVRFESRAASHGLTGVSPASGVVAGALADDRHRAVAEARRAVDALVDHHSRRVARLAAQREAENFEVARLSGLLDELNTRSLPDPPALPWQRGTDRASLAEMVDFAPDLPEDKRAGIEAALEAAGLLGATLADDGALHLATGELVAVGGEPVAAPLSRLVVPALANGDSAAGARLEAVLASISTDPVSAAPTVVTGDGWFRIGALSGRHTKDVAEHVGVGARRAALERQRREMARLLDDARASAATTAAAIDHEERHLDDATALGAAIPDASTVSDALGAADRAANHLTKCRDRLAALAAAVRAAEAAHAHTVTEAGRTAASLSLPTDRPGLADIGTGLDDLAIRSESARGLLAALARSYAAWAAAAITWQHARRDLADDEAQLVSLSVQHEAAAARLATLDDAIGLDYAEVMAALDHSRAEKRAALHNLERARSERDELVEARAADRGDVAAAATELKRLETDSVIALAALRGVLAVPGLLAAAAPPGTEPPAMPVVDESPAGLAEVAAALTAVLPVSESAATADTVRQSLKQRRDSLGDGWDAEDRQPDPDLPMAVEINGPLGRMTLAEAVGEVAAHRDRQASLLTSKQHQALHNLLQGLIAREVTDKLLASEDLVRLMNERLATVFTTHGIGAHLRWRRRDDLDADLGTMIDLLSKPRDLRTPDEDDKLTAALSNRIGDARDADPDLAYRDLVRTVLDYRNWYEMTVFVTRGDGSRQRLTRRTPLSEGEKKIVTYLALFAAVAASCDSVAGDPTAPRFVLLDDAFAKVSEDNHAQLFGLLVAMDLDFIATSERLWGTHASVPALAITEVVRDAEMGVIVLEHARWDGTTLDRAP